MVFLARSAAWFAISFPFCLTPLSALFAGAILGRVYLQEQEARAPRQCPQGALCRPHVCAGSDRGTSGVARASGAPAGMGGSIMPWVGGFVCTMSLLPRSIGSFHLQMRLCVWIYMCILDLLRIPNVVVQMFCLLICAYSMPVVIPL